MGNILKNNKEEESYGIPTKYGVLTKQNMYEKLDDIKIALEVISIDNGPKLLAEMKRYDGWSALHEITWHEKVVLELIKKSENLKLLANTVDSKGMSALHYAVGRERVALEIIKTEDGRRLLGSIKNCEGMSALSIAATKHKSVRKELLNEYIKEIERNGSLAEKK
jgi:hypothetical protein